jgi:hypothetical protein
LVPGWNGAALAHDDGAGADQFTAERLHAQHLGLGIAPFRVEPPPFFCAMTVLLTCSNGADLQFGELLAMALAFLVVLATAHLEDAHLVVLAVCHAQWLSRLRRTPGVCQP